MHVVAGDETRHLSSDGDFQKWLVIGVWQRLFEGGSGDDAAVMFYEVENCGNLVLVKIKLGPGKHILVFRQDSGIKGERQFAGRHHAHNFPARPKRRQQAGDQNIRIKDNSHRARVLRTALISASISSGEIRSAPCSTDRRWR